MLDVGVALNHSASSVEFTSIGSTKNYLTGKNNGSDDLYFTVHINGARLFTNGMMWASSPTHTQLTPVGAGIPYRPINPHSELAERHIGRSLRNVN